ncbi:MAG: hypothetical protein M3619_26550 [Myxococcota bacterium]|nr:hypothetical protein [Myxococcota bacterium]
MRQQAGHFLDEISAAVGLLDEARAAGDECLRVGVDRITGRDQDRDVAELADLREALGAIHHRHAHVEDHEIDLGSVLDERCEPGLAVVGGEHAQALPLEEADRARADRRLVVDHEDGARRARRGVAHGCHLRRARAGGRHRQVHTERRARRGRRVDRHRAAVVVNHAPRDRQPEPGALAGGLGGEERLEHAQPRELIHARAVVGDAQADEGPRADREASGGIVVEHDAIGLDRQRALGGHRIARVEAEVHEDLHELCGVAFDAGVGVEPADDLDRLR